MRTSFLTPTVLALMGLLAISTAPVMGETAAKPHKIPFHGKLQAVDTSADTITIEGKTPRVFHLTPTTKITDGAGAASTLSAAVVGEDVGGSYTKDSAGTMMLFSVRFGAKAGAKAAASAEAAPAAAPAPAANEPAPAPTPAAKPSAAPAAAESTPPAATAKVKKQRISGTVVSVDATANTLVIRGKAEESFTVTSATKITVAGKKATLADVTAAAKVSGSYSTDGTTNTLSTLSVKAAK